GLAEEAPRLLLEALAQHVAPLVRKIEDTFATVAAWACRPEDRDRVESWVRDRRDLVRVTVTDGIRVPRGCAHFSLYVVHEAHPAMGMPT
ncbi:MAG: hypothetical protein EBT97_04470, partial [Actinobacteria bacterium]|nr:hypothetical protein [Actinomycetota bacterium]